VRIVLATACIAFGVIGWVGQLISALHFEFAQKLGLQEKDEGTDPLYRSGERHAARWDALVLWPLIAAGVLLALDHDGWPPMALVAAGIYLDAAGREAAKIASLRKGGVQVGTPGNIRVQKICFIVMAVMAAWLITYTLWVGTT